MINKFLNIATSYINETSYDLYINFRLMLLNKSFLFLILLLLILFSYLGYFIYTNYIFNIINKEHVLNKELLNKDINEKNEDVIIVFFKTEWCPYCKNSLQEWLQFEEYVNNINNENNIKVFLTIVDCDENTRLADKYEIEAYPTIKMFYKGEIYDYDAKPNKNNLIQFLETSIKLN